MMRAIGVHRRRFERGLTLGEMLVVLAVFLILVALFFYSSNTAMVKARLSTALSDERTLARALQSYEGDYMTVPSQDQGLKRLQSPDLRYMSSIPADPFTPSGPGRNEYAYLTDISPDHHWMIISVGPDGESDVKSAVEELSKKSSVKLSESSFYGRAPLMTSKEVQDFVVKYSYDPTNGTFSKGDVITLYGR